jgi:hypothetical protein
MLGSVLNRGAEVDGAAKAVTSTTVMTPRQRNRPARRALIGVGVLFSMALTPQVGLRCADLDGGCGVSTRASTQLGSRPGLAWIADLAVRGAVSSGATDCWQAAKRGPVCGGER